MYSNFSLQVSLTLKRSAIGNVVLKIKIGSLDFDRVETGVLSNGEKVVISEAQTGLISEGETWVISEGSRWLEGSNAPV